MTLPGVWLSLHSPALSFDGFFRQSPFARDPEDMKRRYIAADNIYLEGELDTGEAA